MTKKGKKATVSDIAKRAGVSAATVSRVMNDTDYPVRAELRERVLTAAAQLNYKPNVFSQILKGGSSREIGVIVPSITNLFYAQLVSAVERGKNSVKIAAFDAGKQSLCIHGKNSFR